MMRDLFLHVLSFVVVLSPLVIFHELGHYCVARWCNVKIESFSIGFGPTLFGWTDRHGTHWKVSAFLLGGYVRMLGEDDPATNVLAGKSVARGRASEDRYRTLDSKSPLQKMAIAVAGPLANYILAFFLFMGIFMTFGETLYQSVVGPVSPTSIAAKSGLKEGDRILMMHGKPIKTFNHILDVLDGVPFQSPLAVVVDRQGETLMLSLEAEGTDLSGMWRGHVGLVPDPDHGIQRILGVSDALTKTVQSIKLLTVAPLQMMKARQFDGISGPLGIAQRTAMAWEQGLGAVLSCMAILSVGLGLLNLFPIPVLDGGVILFAFIEALRGKPLSARFQMIISYISFSFLLGLFLFFSWKDLLKLPIMAHFFT